MTVAAFTWTMLGWWQWAMLLAVPPLIVALYFLKLRREPLEVPSTYLWHRTIEDLHVNSIWQRLRQSLLLLLQLLLVFLLIAACLRPDWQTNKLTKNRAVFLIDTSASMGATDVAPTRLEHAKRQVDALIGQMQSGDVAMIVSFSDRALVEQPFTDNRRLLRRKLQEIELTRHSSDLAEALRVAAGLANPGRTGQDPGDVAAAEAQPADLFILSDGGFDRVMNFSMGNLNPTYVPIGAETPDNVGIIAFSARRHAGRFDQLEAFARIENFGPADRNVEAALYLNGELRDASQVKLPAGGGSGVQFTLEEIESGMLRLEISARDALAVDDVAYAAVNVPRRGNVLVVTPGNDALETALGTEAVGKVAAITVAAPKFLATAAYKKQADEAAFDLIVFDQCAPGEMPRADTVFVGRLPPGKSWSAEAPQNGPLIIDSDRAHPLMQFIELGDVRIAEGTPLAAPPGSTPLVDADIGTLMAIGPRGGFEDLVLGFELIGTGEDGKTYVNTNWPIRLSFPLFVNNVLSYFAGPTTDQRTATVSPGGTIRLRTNLPVARVRVTTPAGERVDVPRGKQNTFAFARTDTLGVYEVREGTAKDVSQRFAVNLFSRAESDIAPRKTIGTEWKDIPGRQQWETARFEFWRYLLVSALVVLLFEWYIYNRRVYL